MERKTRSGKVTTPPPVIPVPLPGKVFIHGGTCTSLNQSIYFTFRKEAEKRSLKFKTLHQVSRLLWLQELEEAHEDEVRSPDSLQLQLKTFSIILRSGSVDKRILVSGCRRE